MDVVSTGANVGYGEETLVHLAACMQFPFKGLDPFHTDNVSRPWPLPSFMARPGAL